MFEPFHCIIKDLTSDKIILTTKRYDNTYVLYLHNLLDQNVKCLASFMDKNVDVTQETIGHAHIRLISEISQKELVKSLPKINFDNDSTCEFCQRGKQTKSSFHSR